MYFERATPSGSFVEVEVVGQTLVRRWGRIGSPTAYQREQPFADDGLARLALDKQVRGLLGKGYTAGRGHPELIAAIERAPDEPGPYLVYADWLLEQGDPRGDLIAFMSRGEEARANAWLKEHWELNPTCWGQSAPTLEWRLGFVRKLTLVPDGYYAWEHPLMLRRLLRHPSCWFVREVVLEQAAAPQGSFQLDLWREILEKRRPALTRVVLRRSPALAPLIDQLQGLVTEESGG